MNDPGSAMQLLRGQYGHLLDAARLQWTRLATGEMTTSALPYVDTVTEITRTVVRVAHVDDLPKPALGNVIAATALAPIATPSAPVDAIIGGLTRSLAEHTNDRHWLDIVEPPSTAVLDRTTDVVLPTQQVILLIQRALTDTESPTDRIRRVLGATSNDTIGSMIGTSRNVVAKLDSGKRPNDQTVLGRLSRIDRIARFVDELLEPEDVDAWLDTPLADLDGTTPREALTDPDRTERLVALLAAVATGGPGPTPLSGQAA
ncbi:hypothetical protein [Euzebya pacifica]|nr:hypothetical protein [Euzebya pacifica]